MQLSPVRSHALTVDVEDYFHVASYDATVSPQRWAELPQRVARNTEILLQQFDKHNAKATFFILGWVAERNPELVRQIHAAGHEVASHGYAHAKASVQTAAEFLQDVSRAKAILEDIDLTDHVEDDVNSLRIAFACDESVKTGEVVRL